MPGLFFEKRLIKHYVNSGEPMVVKDGYHAKFRCVVGSEVWNFRIHQPSGKFAMLTDICNDIMRDAGVVGLPGKTEREYIVRLNGLRENN